MTERRYITRKEVDEIVKSRSKLHYKAIIQTAYYGGLRSSEIMDLRRGDLDFKKDFVEINISTGLSNRKISVVEPKETLEKYIERYDISDDMDHLWQGVNGKKLSIRAVTDAINRDSESNTTLHTLRCSRASDLSQEMTEETFCDYFGLTISSDTFKQFRKSQQRQ